MGLYLLGVPVVECSLASVLQDFVADVQRIGGDRVVELHFEATPSSGIWWFFTHVLPFPPSVRVTGIAVRATPRATAPAPNP